MSASTTREERFAHGLEVLKRVDGEAGQRVVDSLADINPELGHQVVAWPSARSTTVPDSPRVSGSW